MGSLLYRTYVEIRWTFFFENVVSNKDLSFAEREQSNILLKATLRAENLTSCNETLFNLNRDREMFDVRFNNGLNLGQICAQDGKDEGRDTCEVSLKIPSDNSTK